MTVALYPEVRAGKLLASAWCYQSLNPIPSTSTSLATSTQFDGANVQWVQPSNGVIVTARGGMVFLNNSLGSNTVVQAVAALCDPSQSSITLWDSVGSTSVFAPKVPLLSSPTGQQFVVGYEVRARVSATIGSVQSATLRFYNVSAAATWQVNLAPTAVGPIVLEAREAV